MGSISATVVGITYLKVLRRGNLGLIPVLHLGNDHQKYFCNFGFVVYSTIFKPLCLPFYLHACREQLLGATSPMVFLTSAETEPRYPGTADENPPCLGIFSSCILHIPGTASSCTLEKIGSQIFKARCELMSKI